ncbi:MAG: ArsC family transcriptional regulator [Bacillota bacterium]|nr:ArsC family transcriptional regulator [Bacillota bacterium]
MNIQIFGTSKSFDTKKAERFFKERNIKVQLINIKEKPMSKGELTSVVNALGGLDKIIDPKAKNKNALALIQYSPEDTKFEKVLERQEVLKLPIVRNKQRATVGLDEKTWTQWINEK